MRNVVPIQHRAGSGDAIADVLDEFGDPDTKAGGRGGEGLWGVAVDVAVFVFAGAENLIGHLLRDAQVRVGDVAGQGFGVAEAGGEVVEVVVEGLVPARVGWGDAGDGVEAAEERLGRREVGCPVWVGAADAVDAVEGGGGGAAVGGLEAVDGGRLDEEGEWAGGVVHG